MGVARPTTTAKQTVVADRIRKVGSEKEEQTLLANFLLTSLQHCHIRCPYLAHTEKPQANADVCAFLWTVDQSFNPQRELEILKDEKRIAQWQAEMDRRDAISARKIANNPIPGVRTFSIGAVGARFRQEIANDPTLSTRQALTNATNAIIMPGSLDFVMDSNPTGITGTTGTNSGSTRATGRNVPTTNDTAVYVADTLGNTDITTSSSSSTAALYKVGWRQRRQ